MELELVTDIGVHLFIIEKNRGSVSVISHRFAKANVAGLEGSDGNKPNEYLVYLDENKFHDGLCHNLYQKKKSTCLHYYHFYHYNY